MLYAMGFPEKGSQLLVTANGNWELVLRCPQNDPKGLLLAFLSLWNIMSELYFKFMVNFVTASHGTA